MKKLYIILLIIGGLTIAGYLFVRFYLQADIRNSRNKNDSTLVGGKNPDSTLDLRPLFIAKIQQLVNQGSKGLYNISIDSMEVDLIQSRVLLRDVQLIHDNKVLAALDSSKQAPDDVFKVVFDTLKIDGINLDDILTLKTIDLKEILITEPTIEVFHTKRIYNTNKTVDSITLFDRIMKDMKSIAVGKLIVQNGIFISHNVAKKNKTTKLNDVGLRFTDILIDSTTKNVTDRFLFARQALLTMKNYAMKTTDDLYLFKIGELAIQAPQQTMKIQNLSFTSRLNRQQFQQRLVHQKEQYNLSIPQITIHNIDWWSFMHENRFIAGDLKISNAKVKIHLDRSLPRPKSKMGNFPHQLIMKIPIQVYIASMHTRNLDLTYEEYNPRSTQTGSIKLNQVNLDISHITNIPVEVKKKKQTIVTGTALLLQIPVKARFAFDLLSYKTGKFSSNISIAGFEGNKVNDIAQPLGLLKIENGIVKNFKLNMQGNEHSASGKVLLLYNDLKISIYEKEKDEQGLDKKGIIGFLANTFVIKDDNPNKNNPPRNPPAEFQRDPQTGFFNLVWKTALNGILKTIGVNPKLAEKK